MHGQVLIAILLGIAVGALWPAFGAALKPLGDAFIKLVKMVIAPVIFLTVTTGIAGMGENENGRNVFGAGVAIKKIGHVSLGAGTGTGRSLARAGPRWQ